jgi:hypothetical protein
LSRKRQFYCNFLLFSSSFVHLHTYSYVHTYTFRFLYSQMLFLNGIDFSPRSLHGYMKKTVFIYNKYYFVKHNIGPWQVRNKKECQLSCQLTPGCNFWVFNTKRVRNARLQVLALIQLYVDGLLISPLCTL